ncbi:MAG: glycosyltransferase family 2 protein [Verrucomicrobia bacterium]|nr:glycosyltransferase family 2 protein [Verrucomicrobiota bacterium]
MNPLVSVIVPVFNGEEYVGETLASIRAQTYSPVELIVIDDGSTDLSVAIAAEYSPDQLIVQSNAGVAEARNHALKKANGEFVAFLDQDDLWAPAALEVQAGLLMENPAAGISFCDSSVALDDGASWPEWLPRDKRTYPPGTWLVRTSVFDRVGLFNKERITGSDTDWLIRARRSGVIAISTERVLHSRRIHRSNASHDTARRRSELFKVLHDSLHSGEAL